MSEFEERAREMLAAECEACGADASAAAIRAASKPDDFFVATSCAVQAIAKALAKASAALAPSTGAFDNRTLATLIDRLPYFNAHWPSERQDRWFEWYFELLSAARAASADTHPQDGDAVAAGGEHAEGN